MALPKFNSEDQALGLLQTAWAAQLDPLIRNVANKSLLLTNVQLVVGNNTINHRLGRKLQGWVLVRKRSSADVYDNQDSNSMPELTLILNSSAAVTVDIEVF